MGYIAVTLIWYVLVALALGIAVGWYSCGGNDYNES